MNYSQQYYEAARYMAETGCTLANQAIRAVSGPTASIAAINNMWTYIKLDRGELVVDLTPEEKVLWLLFLSEAEKERK